MATAWNRRLDGSNESGARGLRSGFPSHLPPRGAAQDLHILPVAIPEVGPTLRAALLHEHRQQVLAI